MYPQSSVSVSKAILSNRFQTRVAILGTVITRVFYIMFVNNQLVSSSSQAQPNSAALKNEFYNAGSDLNVYSFNDSLCKHLLSSLYVKTYPLTPAYRNLLQININSALQTYVYNPISQNAFVVIVYYELYQSQAYGYNVSKVYYYVIF